MTQWEGQAPRPNPPHVRVPGATVEACTCGGLGRGALPPYSQRSTCGTGRRVERVFVDRQISGLLWGVIVALSPEVFHRKCSFLFRRPISPDRKRFASSDNLAAAAAGDASPSGRKYIPAPGGGGAEDEHRVSVDGSRVVADVKFGKCKVNAVLLVL